jgi:hypothetical protein
LNPLCCIGLKIFPNDSTPFEVVSIGLPVRAVPSMTFSQSCNLRFFSSFNSNLHTGTLCEFFIVTPSRTQDLGSLMHSLSLSSRQRVSPRMFSNASGLTDLGHVVRSRSLMMQIQLPADQDRD